MSAMEINNGDRERYNVTKELSGRAERPLGQKDPLRISFSEPLGGTVEAQPINRSHSPTNHPNSNRRERWIRNIQERNLNRKRRSRRKGKSITDESGSQDQYGVDSLRRGHSDSGPQSSTFDTLESTPDSLHDSRSRSEKHYRNKWPTKKEDKTTTTTERLLSFERAHELEVRHGGKHSRSFDISPEHNRLHSLSRQNEGRYSLNLRPARFSSPSGTSISSESEASQEGCENTLNPSSALLNGLALGLGVVGRKHSVVFSYDHWNEDNIIQSFRDMGPSLVGKVLETAWTADNEKLKEYLNNEEILGQLKTSKLREVVSGMTPLHLAAAAGNVEGVQLLLDKGAAVNEFDNQKATALCCAASCDSVPILELLIAQGADINAGINFGKSALHWAVQSGSVECVKKLLEIGAQQNPPAILSETPLHLAAALGDLECLQVLLDHGADTALCKGPNRSQALHLAAEEGNAACINILLKAGASHDAKDLRGHTPLHIASTCDTDSVMVLLRGGASPNAADANGRTPLHCAVSKGSRSAECVRILVDHGADIDAQDNFGYTPLHLAAVNESSQCASILLSRGADVTAKTKAGTTALQLLVRKIPDVMRYLVDRLDAAVTIHDHDPSDPDCEVRLDFRGIVPNVERKQGTGSGKEQTYYHKPRKETEFLTCILAAGNKKILAHPLSEAFLTLKWMRVRKFFWASLLFQIVLVALFTIFVVEVYLIKCPYKRNHEYSAGEVPAAVTTPSSSFIPQIFPPTNPSSSSNADTTTQTPIIRHGPAIETKMKRSSPEFSWFNLKPLSKNRTRYRGKHYYPPLYTTPAPQQNTRIGGGMGMMGGIGGMSVPPDPEPTLSSEDDVIIEVKEICEIGLALTIIWVLLVAFAALMAIKEISQLVQSPCSYVVSSENWGQWALIGSVSMTAYIQPGYELSYWQYPAAAVGIFLAWGLMLLQVGRFPALGMYVQMLGKVAANFGLFILAYACLLIAFALSFCVLFPEYPPYSSVPLSILKVLTMMVGEVDYEDLFYNEDNANDPALYPITAHLLHGSFVIIVTIVLMNLLVGLAVHDIQGLQKGAKLNRLSRQTALISRLESFIFSKRLQSCLPKTVGSVLLKSALLVPSSYNWSFYFRPNDPRDQRLPKDLKLAALRLAATKHSSRTVRGHHDIRVHTNNNNNSYQGSVKGSSAVDPQTQAAVRRIEQRLDKLQLQIELVLKTFNDRFETLSVPVNDANNKAEQDNI